MKAYKIFELGYDAAGNPVPRTLFHGLPRLTVTFANGAGSWRRRRSRTLPIGCWINAEAKVVRDGSGSAQYTSGFHCYSNLDAVRAWFKTASTVNRVAVLVEINELNTRVKNRAVRHTLLAETMKIHAADWDNRIDAEDLV